MQPRRPEDGGHRTQRGTEFGFDVAGLRVDMARVIARKDAIVAKSREGVEAWMPGLSPRPRSRSPACLFIADETPLYQKLGVYEVRG